MLTYIKHLDIHSDYNASKAILFHIFMRYITECVPTYDSENQFLTDKMHTLKQIDSTYKLNMQIMVSLLVIKELYDDYFR